MATIRYAIPGVGGSLGTCAVCGESFVAEILLGGSADSIQINGCERDLPVHKKCGQLVIDMQGPWAEIRDKFPDGQSKKHLTKWPRSKNARRPSGGIRNMASKPR